MSIPLLFCREQALALGGHPTHPLPPLRAASAVCTLLLPHPLPGTCSGSRLSPNAELPKSTQLRAQGAPSDGITTSTMPVQAACD